ncbi:flagellar biosynthetic protein FliO [Cellulomonas sp. PhB150]|uniref:flagellar biosynthetic protein FliO n=1 Tax=Cellulomonas sp. PhB150 TaxID=2485188 RepID=UPI000F4AE8D8|nr:flagellar biosynthetic protein FliO [Cellulomonas sp. PhB150]ROS25770.1 flagellar protein FliO/FliZ [Cellulomonas sp. PhB150]
MDTVMLAARVLLSLACVIGLIWFAGRRLGGPRRVRAQREAEVRLVGKQSVSRHSGVAVVAVGNRRLLVGYGDQQVTMLTELAPVVEAAPAPAPAPAKPRVPAVPVPRAALDAGPTAVPTGATAGPLHGSVLSPETWRTLVKTLQDRTVRR